MRNTLLNGFSEIRHSLSATGREIHPRLVNLCDIVNLQSRFPKTCVFEDGVTSFTKKDCKYPVKLLFFFSANMLPKFDTSFLQNFI